MDNIYDEVEQWRIDITGLDRNMSVLIGARAVITKESFEVSKFPINEREFELLWYKIIEKAKNISIDEARK